LESEDREILTMLAKLTKLVLENRQEIAELKERFAPRLSLPASSAPRKPKPGPDAASR
jgi:hypothetical protein